MEGRRDGGSREGRGGVVLFVCFLNPALIPFPLQPSNLTFYRAAFNHVSLGSMPLIPIQKIKSPKNPNRLINCIFSRAG